MSDDKQELPGYYECQRCFAIRSLKGSYTCPGCLRRNCKDCRCGEAQANPCPTGALSAEEYDALPPGPHVIEEVGEWTAEEITVRLE
jgi:hypothetical protein